MQERMNSLEVPVEKLRWNCDPDSLGVESTADAIALGEKVLAQERAVSALKFGMKMKGNDYNIFVVGQSQTGLSYMTRTFLEDAARTEPIPQDWCYVYNFREPDSPRVITLSRGRARELAKDMDDLIDEIQTAIPDLFESDEYRHRREESQKNFTAERNTVLSELENLANEKGFVLNMSQQGMLIQPSKEDGHVLTEEDLKTMTDEEKDELRTTSEYLQEEMNAAITKIRRLEKELKEKFKKIDRRMALNAVGHLLDDLQEKYEDNKTVIAYLMEVKNDVIKNLSDFKQREPVAGPFPIQQQQEPDFTRFKVNVFIDNSETKGAPVVYETNPTYPNLFGAMERKAVFGALFTDFTMIRPGAIHRANGGYLVLNAKDLLKWMISWEALKRALKNREIRIEDPADMYGVISTKTMKPEPIPLDIKIILIGEPYIYQALLNYEEEFSKLFKVKAQLDDQVNRNEEELSKYVSFAAKMVDQKGLKQVDKTGLSRLLEYGVEVAGRQSKLTLKMAMIRDILREADYWASEDGAEMISREQVNKAIKQKKFRSSLPEEKLRDFLLDGYVNVDTSGMKTGQINGLSVYDMGDYSFGRPSRITASVSSGRPGVLAIDRESKLSGNIHTKGILIMQGYLKAKYDLKKPASMSASLVFEQSYGMVDGDSASAAELYVLLSAISKAPLKQSIAVTGAISQLGEVQPIGGVNQKIEGFFEVCRARELTGEQGVIIPAANVQDLMLKGQVIDAVQAGRFKIWAVDHVDQALEILTDMPIGQIEEDGTYPENTFNFLVMEGLRKFVTKKESEEENNNGRPEENNCQACEKSEKAD